MSQPSSIKQISIWTSRFLLLAILLAAITPAVFWLNLPKVFEMDEIELAFLFLKGQTLTWPKMILGWGITMLPVSCLIYTLLKLRRVFREYSKGRVFSITAVNALRSVGIGGCAMMLAQFFVMPLMSLAMTYDFPQGERQLSVSLGLSSSGMLGFFAAIMFLVLAWVMSEARKNAEDLAMIV